MSKTKSARALVSVLGAALIFTGCTTTSSDKDTNGGTTTTASATGSATATTAPGGSPNTGGNDEVPTPGPGTPTVAPEPTQAPSSAPESKAGTPATLWNPCGIADADMTRLGFRADSKQVLGSDSEPSCRWQSTTGKSEISIGSTHQSVEDFKQSGRYVDFSPIQVAGHDAFRYRAAQDGNKTGCYIGFSVRGGQTYLVTRNLKSDAPEPCEATRATLAGLAAYVN
ncbi:DUF3558 domain-containing protein [Nocardia inohanensis]|uniref:DUF3558 domain-containing protein n=1 Tax=Nocardia inohanensis TaxID=209246 RepID=UPI0008303F34|nr:DUF3558 domain-containing protein [Nocardia inohanensis]